MNPHLVNEDQRLGIYSCRYHHPPGRSYNLITFCSYSSPFFLVEPIRAMARHMVERLIENPVTTSM